MLKIKFWPVLISDWWFGRQMNYWLLGYGAFLLENQVHANCSLLDCIFRMKILSCDNVCKVSTKTMWKSQSSSTCNQLLRNPITICIAGHSFISGNEVNEHAYRNRINNSPFRLRQWKKTKFVFGKRES